MKKSSTTLPLIGAAFSATGALMDIYGAKSDSSELKCMRQEFKKIDKKQAVGRRIQ